MKIDGLESPAHRLILLAGPSCAGKTPLVRALNAHYPHIASTFSRLVLYNSREPRPVEQDGADYHFRSKKFINDLSSHDDFLVLPARGDLQAIDLGEIRRRISNTDLFYEGNSFTALRILDFCSDAGISTVSVFLSPLNKAELNKLTPQEAPHIVFELMKQKLLRRQRRLYRNAEEINTANIDRRASETLPELLLAWRFDYTLPNHAGEESDAWQTESHPQGEAGQVLRAFADVLAGKHSRLIEKWQQNDFDYLREN